MHKNATKCNETLGKWCKNKHGASKIIDTFETYHRPPGGPALGPVSPGRPPKDLQELEKRHGNSSRRDVTYINEKNMVCRRNQQPCIKLVCKKINLDCMPSKEKHQKHEI
jgi:hypothetical protein